MMRILLSNDDGVHATGIHVLRKALSRLGRVYTVAPLEEKSTTGHSLTLHKPLRMIEIEKDVYGVSGSPADCVYMGYREVLGGKPDLVISGINRGANLGQDVYYSGTVSAAREGCILGVPSLAVSLAFDFHNPPPEHRAHYGTAARIAVEVARKLLEDELPKYTLMNLNSPDLPYGRVRGIRLARQGFKFYSGTILRRKDHRGKDYYWVGGNYRGYQEDPETDCYAVDHGYAALTPIRLDSTDFGSLTNWRERYPRLAAPLEVSPVGGGGKKKRK